MILSRRKLIGGIGLVFAAPAIVRASSLMPVKSLAPESVSAWWLSEVRKANVEKTIWLVNWSDGQIEEIYPRGYTSHPSLIS